MKRLALALGAVVCLVAAFWAGRVTTRPAPVPTDAPAAVVLTAVTQRTVGRTLNLSVAVDQPLVPVATNSLAGVVTAVGRGGVITTGDMLYAVNNVPVRAVESSMPFYRPLSVGAAGDDVKALRTALVSLGYAETGGTTFTEGTAEAVKEWQRALGVTANGRIALGELVAIPKLRGGVVLDTKALLPGAALVGGETLVRMPDGAPNFTLVLTNEQAALVPTTSTVEVPWRGSVRKAVVARSQTNEQGQTVLTLTASGGGPVCGDQCAGVVTGSTLHLMSRIQVVPPVTGPAVPVTAITTDPAGQASVLVVKGDQRVRRSVRVLGTQDGVAVVAGVTVGEVVQVFAAGQPAGGASSPRPTER